MNSEILASFILAASFTTRSRSSGTTLADTATRGFPAERMRWGRVPLEVEVDLEVDLEVAAEDAEALLAFLPLPVECTDRLRFPVFTMQVYT